jgi:hypothetical protein
MQAKQPDRSPREHFRSTLHVCLKRRLPQWTGGSPRRPGCPCHISPKAVLTAPPPQQPPLAACEHLGLHATPCQVARIKLSAKLT